MRLSIPHSLTLPRICLICDMHYQDPCAVCPPCLTYLPYLKKYCHSCGALPKEASDYCGTCLHEGSILHRFYAPFNYEYPIKSLIHRYKFQQSLDLSHFFAEQIIQILPKEAAQTQCLIPVPLHPKKLKQRGFHQTWFLAKKLSKELKIPLSSKYCQKILHTPAQSELRQEERPYNLTHAFQFTKPPYTHITLIDDVHTTGTTLNLIAQGFADLGVETIDAWVIAKA